MNLKCVCNRNSFLSQSFAIVWSFSDAVISLQKYLRLLCLLKGKLAGSQSTLILNLDLKSYFVINLSNSGGRKQEEHHIPIKSSVMCVGVCRLCLITGGINPTIPLLR
jgi:hypothetical protein